MNRKYLAASAVILLLGGCGSSKKGSPADGGVRDSRAGTQADTYVPADAYRAADTGRTVDSRIDAQPDTGAGLGDSGGDRGGGGADVGGADVGGADVGGADVGGVVVDAAAEVGAPDADMTGADAKVDAASTLEDAAADAAQTNLSDVQPDTTTRVYDGGLGQSCVTGLFGTYVLRWDGILIDETDTDSPHPVFDASTGLPLTGVVSAQMGPAHGCAALADGTVRCWQAGTSGGNDHGQLGNGSTTAVTTSYQATSVLTAPSTPLAHVVAMVDGTYNNAACGITSDGKMWCWGDLSWLVNNGTVLNTGYAQAITKDGTTPLTGVMAASMGQDRTCALVAGTPNSVWCWGNSDHGELGQGDTTAHQYPIQVPGLVNPTQIALAPTVEAATVCVLDGTGVKCWGVNGSVGVVGANLTAESAFSPTPVVFESGAALDGVTQLRPGNASLAALRSDGTIWAWGWRYKKFAADYGQTNVLAIGWAGPSGDGGDRGLRFLTSDGAYHVGPNTGVVNCEDL